MCAQSARAPSRNTFRVHIHPPYRHEPPLKHCGRVDYARVPEWNTRARGRHTADKDGWDLKRQDPTAARGDVTACASTRGWGGAEYAILLTAKRRCGRKNCDPGQEAVPACVRLP